MDLSFSEAFPLPADVSATTIDDSFVDDAVHDPEIEKAILKIDHTGILQFRCSFCSYLSELEPHTKEHIASEHPDWKAELSKKGRSKSSHSNPNWLHELQSNFKKIIIDDCSRRARDAV